MDNKLFEFTLRAIRLSVDTKTPASSGAYVSCYAADVDYQSAIKKAAVKLQTIGFRFDNIESKVRELEASTWQEYVQKVWPDLIDDLPKAGDIANIIEAGGVFFGPIACFEDQ